MDTKPERQSKSRAEKTLISLRLKNAIAADFKDFCWTTRQSHEQAFYRAFDMLRAEQAKVAPTTDPKVRLMADAILLAVREGKRDGLL